MGGDEGLAGLLFRPSPLNQKQGVKDDETCGHLYSNFVRNKVFWESYGKGLVPGLNTKNKGTKTLGGVQQQQARREMSLLKKLLGGTAKPRPATQLPCRLYVMRET